MKSCTGYPVEGLLAPEQKIREALERASRKSSSHIELSAMAYAEESMPDPFEGPVGRIIRMVMVDAHDRQEAQVQFDITESSIVVRYGLEGKRRDFMSAPSRLRQELVRQLHCAANAIPGQEGQLHLQKPGERISFAIRFQATAEGQEVILEPLT